MVKIWIQETNTRYAVPKQGLAGCSKMLHNPLADALSVIKNAEKASKKTCEVRHVSRVLLDVLSIMKDAGYIASFGTKETIRGRVATVELAGSLNDCKAIVPRFYVKKGEYEKWEKRVLPASDMGLLIVSTSKGVKNHREIKGKLGGALIAYLY